MNVKSFDRNETISGNIVKSHQGERLSPITTKTNISIESSSLSSIYKIHSRPKTI